MRIVLLGPGDANDKKERAKWSFYTVPLPVYYVGKVFPGGAIYFPHVDSCVAIVFKLKGGSVVGGHAGIHFVYKKTELYEPNDSLKRVLTDMKKICGGQVITRIFVIGNIKTKDWKVEKTVKTQFPNITVDVKDKTPINVVVDVGTFLTEIKVYDYDIKEENKKWMYGSKTAAATYYI